MKRRTVTVEKFETEDGKLFDTREEALDHEQTSNELILRSHTVHELVASLREEGETKLILELFRALKRLNARD